MPSTAGPTVNLLDATVWTPPTYPSFLIFGSVLANPNPKRTSQAQEKGFIGPEFVC